MKTKRPIRSEYRGDGADGDYVEDVNEYIDEMEAAYYEVMRLTGDPHADSVAGGVASIKLEWQKHNRDNGLSWNEVAELVNQVAAKMREIYLGTSPYKNDGRDRFQKAWDVWYNDCEKNMEPTKRDKTISGIVKKCLKIAAFGEQYPFQNNTKGYRDEH